MVSTGVSTVLTVMVGSVEILIEDSTGYCRDRLDLQGGLNERVFSPKKTTLALSIFVLGVTSFVLLTAVISSV